ncbi:hypothetical protein ACFJIX_06285 [Roseateles sp. UC29_93]|uniref:hypothetical protein n=1 Tax=Roseateles sp. UC29_93 TaxID=3350177 RepID=UPI00366AC9D9
MPFAAPESLDGHRVHVDAPEDVLIGEVRYSPLKSLWLLANLAGALVGVWFFLCWSAVLMFVMATVTVLLLGHSLGSHRKLIHDSYQAPRWLERLLIWFGVQVGLAGPLGLLRQHELRDLVHVQGTGQVVRGLPALCVSLSARGALASWAAAALLPMAAAWESGRSASQPA